MTAPLSATPAALLQRCARKCVDPDRPDDVELLASLDRAVAEPFAGLDDRKASSLMRRVNRAQADALSFMADDSLPRALADGNPLAAALVESVK